VRLRDERHQDFLAGKRKAKLRKMHRHLKSKSTIENNFKSEVKNIDIKANIQCSQPVDRSFPNICSEVDT
jgi:hypothetical protein